MKRGADTVYPWQQAVWQQLAGYVQQQRIPQALLVNGSPGWGKRHLADSFAKVLLCHAPTADQRACGVCQSCHLFDAQTHPDYLLIEPDEPGKAIGIDKIRQLIVKLALKPQFTAYRVVIIQPADALNNASANAFLKCLEEPSERTSLFLLTEQPAKLPATIRSRCQKIDCVPANRALAVQWLNTQGVGENSDLLLRLAQGAPLLAKRYADQGVIEIRQAYFKQWLEIAQGKGNLLAVAEQWQKSDALDLSVLMTWMSSWLVDIVKYAQGIEIEGMQNPDLKKSLQVLAERLELRSVFRFYDTLLIARSQLATQLNKQLMMEHLLISWSQLNHR